MKTNHQRAFKEIKPRSQKGVFSRDAKLSDGTYAGVRWGGDATNGNRGWARQKHGAKKRLRVKERLAGKKTVANALPRGGQIE